MINLEYQIDLNKLGKNSHYDEGKALIIKNVTVFAPGSFVGFDGELIDIGKEAIENSKWKDLLTGRPVVEGHEDVDSQSLGLLWFVGGVVN